MCHYKGMSNSNRESDDDSSDDDISMTDSSSDYSDSDTDDDDDDIPSTPSTSNEEEEEEEEDEVIKAIKAAKEKKKEHPPDINSEDFVVNVSFHPRQNILAASLITGDINLYKYSNEGNELTETFEVHLKPCRDIKFNQDGSVLYSCGKDQCISLTDIPSGNLRLFYENAHEDPLFSLYIISENLFSTGDETGTVKVWDIRQPNAVFSIKGMEDYVSAMITNSAKRHLVCTSGDGSMTTINLTSRKLHVQTEEYDCELNSAAVFRQETKLLVGSSKGRLYLFNWGEFGLHSDMFPGPKHSISTVLPITENIAAVAYDDGTVRAVHIYPNRHLGVIGQHEFCVECVDISHDGEFIASSSADQKIKFWNIKYFENMHIDEKKVSKKDKDMARNLPSSKYQNMSDFFSGLT